MTKRILAVISAVCLAVGLTYGASKTMHQAQAAQSVDWGMYDTNYPSDMSRINSLNTSLGRNAHIIHWYREWSESCSSSGDQSSISQQIGLGNIPMITWETYNGTSNSQNPYPLTSISSGQFDSYIDSCAGTWKAGLGSGTMYVRIDQEMNDGCCSNGGYPWSVTSGNPFGNTPAQYAAMYQHVISRLRADGVNAKFIWNPDGDLANHPIPSGTYPGDGSVDFIGFDYYDFSGTPFQNDYNLIVQQSATRPVLIGEMGASPTNSQYVTDITNSVNAGTVPRLAALVWFNEGGSTLQVGSATFNSLKNLLAITGGPSPTPTPTPTPSSTPTPTPSPTPTGPTACSAGGNQLVATTGAHAMGGIATSSVAGVSWDKNQRLDAFVRGTDGAIWHTASANDGTNWSAWESLGGGILSGTSPSVASWGPNRLDVFVTGNDNQLWQQTWNGSSWSGWLPLGGYLDNASPAAVSWGLDRIDLMVRSTNESSWHRSYSGTWSGWDPQGGALSSAPAAASQAAGTLDFFTHAGSQVWKDSWTGSTWTGWTLVGSGSNVVGDPAAGSCANGRLAVVDDGASSSLHYLGFVGAWSSWNALNLTGNGPGLATSGGNLDLFDTGVPSASPQHYRVGSAA